MQEYVILSKMWCVTNVANKETNKKFIKEIFQFYLKTHIVRWQAGTLLIHQSTTNWIRK